MDWYKKAARDLYELGSCFGKENVVPALTGEELKQYLRSRRDRLLKLMADHLREIAPEISRAPVGVDVEKLYKELHEWYGDNEYNDDPTEPMAIIRRHMADAGERIAAVKSERDRLRDALDGLMQAHEDLDKAYRVGLHDTGKDQCREELRQAKMQARDAISKGGYDEH